MEQASTFLPLEKKDKRKKEVVVTGAVYVNDHSPNQILKIHSHKNLKMARWALLGQVGEKPDLFRGKDLGVLPCLGAYTHHLGLQPPLLWVGGFRGAQGRWVCQAPALGTLGPLRGPGARGFCLGAVSSRILPRAGLRVQQGSHHLRFGQSQGTQEPTRRLNQLPPLQNQEGQESAH